MKTCKTIILFFVVLASSSTYGEFIPRNYYYCEENYPGTMGYFTIQQIDGTSENPYVYDPKKPSREYIRFSYSSHPIPFGFAPIVSETDKEIFAQGTMFANQTPSEMDEFYIVVIDKDDLSLKGRIMNYKGDVITFQSKCSKKLNDVRK